MEEYVENLLAENAALRRKLQSKAEALLILSKDLDECRRERDQFQLMAEQVQHRHLALKKKSLYLNQSPLLSSGGSGDNGEDRAKALRLEAEEMRQQLRDAHSDIKALRAQMTQQRSVPSISRNDCNFPAHQKEEMVQQLEAMSIKNSQLSRDLQALLDEKEELVSQRDSLRCKVHRLNHELHQSLSLTGAAGDAAHPKVDLDAIITENVYLHERVQQAEQERELAAQSIAKYKSMLDKKRSKGAIKLGSSNNSGMVISHKQDILHPCIRPPAPTTPPLMCPSLLSYMVCAVQQLLTRGSQLPNTAAALADMRSLCLALLEALSDKGTALTHQKRTNRVLGRRVAELERRLGAEGSAVFPSTLLLANYAGADVDKEVGQILAAAEREEEAEAKALAAAASTSSSASSAKVGAKESLDEDEDEDCLPPQLQQMVLKALEDIKRESQCNEMQKSPTTPTSPKSVKF
ncbi:hypothetical protein B566_EDAN007653 [Ephemera danica]|nr:hypothetical protein B566_EDAN007653 [Ephemera danica]